MMRLDDYQSALLAAFTDISDAKLDRALDEGGQRFASFIVDHGLGPLWHVRTGRPEFRTSRLSAEALYLAQQHALENIDAVLDSAGIGYAVFKGAANRLLLYENPATRTCHDIDLVVRHEDRVQTAAALVDNGFATRPFAHNIGHELVLSQGVIDIDLHWGLLREGRLRRHRTADILDRRRRSSGVWMLNADDAFFMLLVHPAFAKHLAGWGMGLHRVVDIVEWARKQSINWRAVYDALALNGVRTAAWATLRWVQLVTHPHAPAGLDEMLSDTRPGRLRRTWLDWWLRNNLSERTSNVHWARLLGFSVFLHDTPGDSMRALAGRYRAHRRSADDLANFRELSGE